MEPFDPDRLLRRRLFDEIDVEGRGQLTLKCLMGFMPNLLGVATIVDEKWALRRAYEAAKAGARGEYTARGTTPQSSVAGSEGTVVSTVVAGSGYDAEPSRKRDRAAALERAEFRLFLLYLKRYFELYACLDVHGAGHDHPIPYDQ